MSEHEPHQPEAETPGKIEAVRDSPPPRVWIGSLADYNNGVLHGEWMNAAVEPNELLAHVHAMLARSEEQPVEEWMVFDYEGFVGFRVNEYEDLDTLTKVARGIVEHGAPFGALAELHGGRWEVLDHFDEIYLGVFESREAWAQSIVDDFEITRLIDQALDLPDWLKGYIRIDLAGIAHELAISGDVVVEDNPDGGVWVFDGRV